MRAILKLEEKMQMQSNDEVQEQIQNIISQLSVEDILELDDYIMSKTLFDKNKNFWYNMYTIKETKKTKKNRLTKTKIFGIIYIQ